MSRGSRVARRDATRRKQNEILAAALRCFDDRGVVNATMEDIRATAGVSVGSLYHHFPSKEAVAAALYVNLINAYKTSLEEALATTSGPRAWVRAIIEHHIRWSMSNAAATRFLLAHREPEVRRLTKPEVAEMNRSLEARLQTWLDDHSRGRRVRRMPADIYVSVLIGPAHAYVRRWVAGSATTSPQDAIEALSDAAWRAVRTERTDAGRMHAGSSRRRRRPAG